jgi:hypothetical protein
MFTIIILAAPLALLFTPFRRCLFIGPMLLAAVVGGWMANDALWQGTGGQYGECTDICFKPHKAGSASAAYIPLWTLTVVAIGAIVIWLSYLLVRSSIAEAERRSSLAPTS